MKYPSIRRLGLDAFTNRNQWNHEQCVCQTPWEMHNLMGCLHTCGYCHIDKFFNIMLNLEEVLEKLKEMIQEYPFQQLCKYDNYTDQIPFESKYEASELFITYFGNLYLEPRKYILIYTKSNSVDHLLNLNHNDRVIIN